MQSRISNLIANGSWKGILQNIKSCDIVQILKKTHANNPKTRELDEILSSIYQPKKLEKTLDFLLLNGWNC
ncbi:hypothetical protein HYD93_00820 [Mycoplasmopsis bovis]|nr:hypothetical protein [Mycoplasmopsis bovis]QQH35115.1 hypothetical protein HYD93_00820 [Mycoplasmopsis bovis]